MFERLYVARSQPVRKESGLGPGLGHRPRAGRRHGRSGHRGRQSGRRHADGRVVPRAAWRRDAAVDAPVLTRPSRHQLLDAFERGRHVLAGRLGALAHERLGERGLAAGCPSSRAPECRPRPARARSARSGRPRTGRSGSGPRVCHAMSRFGVYSTTVLTIEYGMPIFIDMPNLLPSSRRCGSPFASRTVPDPSMSRCRRGSTSSSKIASGGAGMTRSTVSTSGSSLMRAAPYWGSTRRISDRAMARSRCSARASRRGSWR